MNNKNIILSPVELGKVDLLLQEAMKIENAALCAVRIHNPLTKSLQFLHHNGLESLLIEPYNTISSASETVCARAFRMASCLMIAEVETDLYYKRLIKSGKEVNFKALHCAPIFSKADEVIGILTTYYDKSVHLSESNIQLKNLLAAGLTPIFENIIINHSKRFPSWLMNIQLFSTEAGVMKHNKYLPVLNCNHAINRMNWDE